MQQRAKCGLLALGLVLAFLGCPGLGRPYPGECGDVDAKCEGTTAYNCELDCPDPAGVACTSHFNKTECAAPQACVVSVRGPTVVNLAECRSPDGGTP